MLDLWLAAVVDVLVTALKEALAVVLVIVIVWLLVNDGPDGEGGAGGFRSWPWR